MGEIRPLTYEELDEHFALSQFAFQYERTPEEIEKAKAQIKPGTIWGYFEGEQLASKLTILPLDTYLYNRKISMGGIASVATWPEFRRKGLVAQLLVHSLQVMREQGQVLSFLHPFSYPFYRKYGWEMHGEYKEYTIQVEQIPKLPCTKGRMRRVGKEIERLHPIYTAFAQQYNGMLGRDQAWWEHRVFSSNPSVVAVYENEAGESTGYLIYKVKEREMDIAEMVYLDHDAYCGLWQFMKQHDSMIQKVTYQAPMDEQLSFLLQNPEIEQQVKPYFMARIVDAAALLKQIPFSWTGKELSLFLHITDEHAPWNDGSFHLQWTEEGVEVTPFQKKHVEGAVCQHPPKRGLRCDIQTLSAMLLGYQSPSRLYEIGRLQGSKEEVELWESMLPRKTTYLLDFF